MLHPIGQQNAGITVISSIIERIRLGKVRLAVLGLGHVGLPTALVFARAGFHVKAIDIDVNKVRGLKQGKCYVREPGLEEILSASLKNGTFEATTDMSSSIRTSDFVSICVPTPVENGVPDLKHFEAAFEAVKAGAHEGMVMLIESTLPPSTTSKMVEPGLRRLGYKVDEEIFIAYCPERITPGHALEELSSNTRIIGGVGPNSSKLAAEFFKTVCKLVVVTDPLTAEITKLAENTFRDVNIAYANSLALITEDLGADVNDVIGLANTHPRVAIHRPGLGVGGPCLPKDPYMLIQGLPKEICELVVQSRILSAHMSKHAVNTVVEKLVEKGVDMKHAKICVLGVTYKPDTEDITNSPTKLVVSELMRRGALISTYDPNSQETYGANRASSIEDALRDTDCVIIVTAHAEFRSIDPEAVAQLAKPHCIVFDGPRMLDPTRVMRTGLTYLGTGYGRAGAVPTRG
jgi:UDP-N-acetyl-D-mannosaminuronic acid dehydrogenase